MAVEDTTCVLNLTLTKAEGLANTETFGTQDPFAKLQCAGQTFKSAVVKDGGTAFDFAEGSTFSFVFPDRDTMNSSDLYLTLYNKNRFGDEKIGFNSYEVKDLIETSEPTFQTLLSTKKKPRGSIEIACTYDDPVETAEKEAAARAAAEEVARQVAEAEAAARAEAERLAEEARKLAEEENAAALEAMQAQMEAQRLAMEAEIEAARKAAEEQAAARAAAEAAAAAAAAERERLMEAKAAAEAARAERVAKRPACRAFVSEPVAVNEEGHAHASVMLTAGWKAVGGGAKIEFEGGGELLAGSFPEVSVWGWNATVISVGDVDPTAKVTAYCIGMWDPDNLFDVKQFKATSEPGAHVSASAEVEEGYELTGGGGYTECSEGQRAVLTASFPNQGKSWDVSAKDHNIPGVNTVTSIAIGVKPNEGTPPIVALCGFAQDLEEEAHPSALTEVPDECTITCGGARVETAGSGNLMYCTYPELTVESEYGGWDVGNWIAKFKDHGVSSPGKATSYCVGLKQAVEEAEE